VRLPILTSIAMFAFAANSVLARLALSNNDIDPLAYTGFRLVSGALVLVAIVYLRSRNGALRKPAIAGSWSGAFALLLYAATFSTAYVMIGAGPGALILFASVQIGMLAWAAVKGERPTPLGWTGVGIAFGALVYLVSPGLVAPSLTGAILMVTAGVSWGAYSLIGRGSKTPLADTAGNFIRCSPVGIVLILVGSSLSATNAEGLTYALASGALASGLGYIIWYSVLPSLSRTRAAFVQLAVPAIAAAGGVVFIGEALTGRLLLATAGIIGGVALALVASKGRNSPATAE
jgi:drug/metabolite transporter (DMT)-like permease